MTVRAAGLSVSDRPFLTSSNDALFSETAAEDNGGQFGNGVTSAFATAAVSVNSYEVVAANPSTYSPTPEIPYLYLNDSAVWLTNPTGLIGNAWNERIGSNRWQQQQMPAQNFIPPDNFTVQNVITITTVNPASPLYQRAFWVGPPLLVEFGPEPSTILLMFSGLAAGCIWTLRRKRSG
jgi:hypothetical protein